MLNEDTLERDIPSSCYKKILATALDNFFEDGYNTNIDRLSVQKRMRGR